MVQVVSLNFKLARTWCLCKIRSMGANAAEHPREVFDISAGQNTRRQSRDRLLLVPL